MKISEEEARLRVGLAIMSKAPTNVDPAKAFADAFEHKETTETKTEGVRKNVKVYRELSKVDEILNTAIEKNIVEGSVKIRRLVGERTEIVQG